MNQGMPMWPNNPNMNPNMGGWQNFNSINQRLNSLENQVNSALSELNLKQTKLKKNRW